MRTRALLGVIVMLAGVFALAPQAEAAVKCPANPPPGSSVGGNITVPTGQTCTLQEVTVSGNVTVSPGGELIVQGGKIGGNLRVTDGWFFISPFRTVPVIGGSVLADAPRDELDCTTITGGDFTISNWNVFTPPPTPFPPCGAVSVEHIGGDLSFLNNGLGIIWFTTAINGNFTATGNGASNFNQLSINGSAKCSNTPPATFTNSTVGGNNTCPG